MFVWKKEDPVQINTNLHLPRFTLERYLTDYCTSKTNTGEWTKKNNVHHDVRDY